MAKVRRYIVGSRRGPQLTGATAEAVEAFTQARDDARIVRTTAVGRKVVEMTEAQARELAQLRDDLIVEDDQELELFGMPGLPEVVPEEGKFLVPVTVRDARAGIGIPGVTLYAIGDGPAYKSETGPDGHTVMSINERSVRMLIASPADTYWSRVVRDVDIGSTIDVELDPLVVKGEYGWGHCLLGFDRVNPYLTGRDVSIAVVDSGISDQVAELRPAGGTNTLDGQDPAAWNVDEKGHGTHVAGVVIARHDQSGIKGGAPDAKVYSVKVFPGGYISDLVEALEWCIRERVDIISLSLGSANRSQVLEAVIADAYERGITCVAAAGNDATAVAYPAAFPTTIAVGAIGRFGTFPEDSANAMKVGSTVDRWGGLFSASFTNFGPEVDVCAPGVAILSTVPTGYAAWDGTSMACPLVSALVAVALEANPALRTGEASTPETIRSILWRSSLDLGMSPLLQGYGLPRAPQVVTAAQQYFGATAWGYRAFG